MKLTISDFDVVHEWISCELVPDKKVTAFKYEGFYIVQDDDHFHVAIRTPDRKGALSRTIFLSFHVIDDAIEALGQCLEVEGFKDVLNLSSKWSEEQIAHFSEIYGKIAEIALKCRCCQADYLDELARLQSSRCSAEWIAVYANAMLRHQQQR